MTLIENSDRGFTINKTLGWTMLTAIVAAVFWFGQTISGLQHSTRATADLMGKLELTLATYQVDTRALEARLAKVEREAVRSDVNQATLSASLIEVKVALRELNDLLREQTGTAN